MKNLKNIALRFLHRAWPVLAGIGIFAVAQLLAYVVPHRCTF